MTNAGFDVAAELSGSGPREIAHNAIEERALRAKWHVR
jgi:hypothetical protein